MSISPLTGHIVPFVREHNRQVILRTLLRHGPISRRRISEITSIGPATITNLVADLLAEDIVSEVGSERAKSPHNRGGRRQILVDLNPGGAFFVGVHLGMQTVAVTIGDLRGNVRCQRVIARPGEGGAEAALAAATALIHDLLKVASYRDRLKAIGTVAIGVVDPVRGNIRYAPQLGWRDVPVCWILGDQFGVPVVVDNNRRAIMLGETLLGVAQDARNALLIHVATTIGAALLLDGHLLYGDAYGAGQLGHVVVDPDGPPCSCGGRGCLDVVASEVALVAQATRQIGAGRESAIRHLADGRADRITPSIIYTAAAQGDALADELVAVAARTIGTVLIPVLGLLDPELLIMTGGIQNTGNSFFQPLRETVEPHMRRTLGREIPILPGRFGAQANTLGAISLGIDHFLNGTGMRQERQRIFGTRREPGSSHLKPAAQTS